MGGTPTVLSRQEAEDAYREAHSPLTTQGILWVAALDRVPIEERVEWVAAMTERDLQQNSTSAKYKDLRDLFAALLDANAALEADRDKAVTALALIESNKHGESYSAGVAMSALSSIEEQTAAREKT